LKIDSRQAASLGLVAGVHSEENAIRQILQHSWGPFFGHRPYDRNAGKVLLKLYSKENQWNWENCVLPTIDHSKQIVQNSKDSAPGKDGVCNAAWRNGGQFSQTGLHNFFLGQCIGKPTERDYNDGHWIFPPKKTNPSAPPKP